MRFFLLLPFLFTSFPEWSQEIKTSLTYSITKPAVVKGKPPVLFVLHGYGADENDLLNIARSVDKHFMVFCLRAPQRRKEGGFCWYDIQFLPDSFKYDYLQVQRSKALLFSFISNACKAFDLDSNRVFLMGFSQGAIMSYDLAFSKPDKINGVIAMSGRMMAETRKMNPATASLSGIKFFIGHGSEDKLIKVVEADKACAFLNAKKVKTLVCNKYPVAHGISEPELADIRWLENAATETK